VIDRIAQAALGGTSDVFETMRRLTPSVGESDAPAPTARLVSGIVALVSQRIKISMILHFPHDLAERMTMRLVGAPPGKRGQPKSEIFDAVGEIANMVAGRVKNKIGREDLTLAISIPIVVDGGRFGIEGGDHVRGFRYRLEIPEGFFWIEGAVLDRAAPRDRAVA
jgi:chemotaxis protein CheX